MGFPGKAKNVGVQCGNVWGVMKLGLGSLPLGICSARCEAIPQLICPVVGASGGIAGSEEAKGEL